MGPLVDLRIRRLRPRTLQAIRIPCTLRWTSRILWRIQNLRIWISLLRIRISRQYFYLNICLDTTQMCSESKSRNVESHLSKSSETKKKSENKTSAWAVLKKKKKNEKKKNLLGVFKKKKKKKKKK